MVKIITEKGTAFIDPNSVIGMVAQDNNTDLTFFLTGTDVFSLNCDTYDYRQKVMDDILRCKK